MDDLISRQQLRAAMYHEAFEKDSDLQKWDSGCWIRYKLFENVIDNLPSAQPEIVRCKDCKWYDIFHPYGTVMPDAFHCKMNDRFYDTHHYCAYGERRS